LEKGFEILEGIKIIDFSHVFQGPMCTQLLGDFGADIIKIERPGSGDWSRSWGPFIHDVSLPFLSLNRNKRSLAINLKNDAAKEVLSILIQTADVLVHNFRPGIMDKLGLGYERLKTSNPGLIYVYSSGWGDKGPYVDSARGGHDLMARASTGLFEPIGSDNLPVPAGISADYPAGLIIGWGILLALLARNKTGNGQYVSTDLFSVAFHANTWKSAERLNRDKIDKQGTLAIIESVIQPSFKTKDGFIEISPVFSDNALRDLSVGMGLGDLSQDKRFGTIEKQLANRSKLNAILAEHFLELTTQDWISKLEPLGILCSKINSYEEAAEDPQLRVNQMILETVHPRADAVNVLGTPLRIQNYERRSRKNAPPELGEHNHEILRELGYTNEEIQEFEQLGVFG
jgi:crotonobetainyl-CoA:carnitine CoA-transferase CaiB-like acyl-CoA transferase